MWSMSSGVKNSKNLHTVSAQLESWPNVPCKGLYSDFRGLTGPSISALFPCRSGRPCLRWWLYRRLGSSSVRCCSSSGLGFSSARLGWGGGTGRDCLDLPRLCSGAGDAACLGGWALPRQDWVECGGTGRDCLRGCSGAGDAGTIDRGDCSLLEGVSKMAPEGPGRASS